MIAKIMTVMTATLGVGELGARHTYGKSSVDMFRGFCARHSMHVMSEAPEQMPCAGGGGRHRGGPYGEGGHRGGRGPPRGWVEGQQTEQYGPGQDYMEENAWGAADFMHGGGPRGEHYMGEHHMGGHGMGHHMDGRGGVSGEHQLGRGRHGWPYVPCVKEPSASGLRGAAREEPMP